METLQLLLSKEAFKELTMEKPGKTYRTLCERFPLIKLKNKAQHSSALRVLMKLSDVLGKRVQISSQEKKQLLDYMEALGLLVEAYEKKVFEANVDHISGSDILEFLIEEHSLRQSDLIEELGSQSIVSEILSNKRSLNSHQILALSKRFNVSPAVFFP